MTSLKNVWRWIRAFGDGEAGLVTVEWIALAGAVVVGGIAVAYPIASSLSGAAGATATNLTDCDSIGSPAGCN